MIAMALPVPSIDDKTFEKLIEEARALIPRYAKDWTDHNVSDPGITFIELFAWLAEMQMFSMDQGTDEIFMEFLKLVDMTPAALTPAVKFIHFAPQPQLKSALIECGTPILPAGEKDFHFETVDDVFLTDNRIDAVLSNFGSKSIDYTLASSTPGSYFIPFGEEMPAGAAFQIGFRSWFTEEEIRVSFFLENEAGIGFKDLFELPYPVRPSVELAWEYYSRDGWRSIGEVEDSTGNLTRSGFLTFRPPPNAGELSGRYWLRCRLVKGKYEYIPRIDRILLNCLPIVQVKTVVRKDLGAGTGMPGQHVELYPSPAFTRAIRPQLTFRIGDIPNWLQFLDRLTSSQEPAIERIRGHLSHILESVPPDGNMPSDSWKYRFIALFNTLLQWHDLYQKDAFRDYEIPGDLLLLIEKREKNISAKEIEKLNRGLIDLVLSDVIIPREMRLQVQRGEDEWKTWKQTDSFDGSGPEDPSFRFMPDERRILFGNGVNGRIPQTRDKIRIGPYWVSDGIAGNITGDRAWTIGKQGLSGISGKDLGLGSAGSDEEPIETAKLRARQEFTTVHRAVTLDDFERLAVMTPGLRVARAKAIPNFDPDYPCISRPGAVTVIVVPYFWDDRPFVEAGTGFIQNVQDHLDAHRLVTTRVRVIGPTYVKISIECNLKITKRSDPKAVADRVVNALDDFFHPLKGGVQKNGWPVGRPVFASEIYELIDPVEGVEYLTDLVIRAGDRRESKDGFIPIPKWGLVYSGKHNLITTGSDSSETTARDCLSSSTRQK